MLIHYHWGGLEANASKAVHVCAAILTMAAAVPAVHRMVSCLMVLLMLCLACFCLPSTAACSSNGPPLGLATLLAAALS